jgi:hypothetical protein
MRKHLYIEEEPVRDDHELSEDDGAAAPDCRIGY